jgi:uncharacterized protein with GYD domain
MTRLAPESLKDADVRRAMGRAWLKKVQTVCPEVKWIAHYAILGPYDFMDIYDAPSAEAAHKVSLITQAEGAVSTESWQALPDCLASVSEVPLFALFGFVASQFGGASGANNAKSGTCVVEVVLRTSLGVAEVRCGCRFSQTEAPHPRRL